MEQSFELHQLWARVTRNRGTIAAFAAAGTVVGVVLALVLPAWYQAGAPLLPPSESESGFGLVSLLRGISVPGITIPTEATPADVFLAVLRSRRLNTEIIKQFDLQTRYKRKKTEDALRELARHSKFKLTEAGTIEINVEDRDPKRAADMANAYVDLLDRFNRDVRMTKGRRTRLFVEGRLQDTKTQLAAAEQKLAEYEARHKTAGLSPEASSSVESAARLYAQRTNLEVRLGVVRGYTRASTDEETQIQEQLDELDRQLAALPQTGLEQARLLRDVKTYEQVYVLLNAQYEEARIDEARDVTTVEILDPAIPPERRSHPRRSLLVGVGLLLGLGVGLTAVVVRRPAPQA
jgi:tyrosine-protein kinase Etk/Wzc